MQTKQLEKWIWILIYGGLLGASLGWFIESHNEAAGWALIVAGAVVAVIGAVLIFVRSRMGP
jgi:F0F1-type ATP synthase assembly protein I